MWQTLTEGQMTGPAITQAVVYERTDWLGVLGGILYRTTIFSVNPTQVLSVALSFVPGPQIAEHARK